MAGFRKQWASEGQPSFAALKGRSSLWISPYYGAERSRLKSLVDDKPRGTEVSNYGSLGFRIPSATHHRDLEADRGAAESTQRAHRARTLRVSEEYVAAPNR